MAALVEGEVAQRLFREIAGPEIEAAGFAPPTGRAHRFTRAAGPGVAQFLELAVGPTCQVLGGIELGFAAAKKARRRGDVELFPLHKHGWDGTRADRTRGEAFFREDLVRHWKTVGAGALAWLEGTRTLEGIVAALEDPYVPLPAGPRLMVAASAEVRRRILARVSGR